jgi:hypothetical protein
MISTDLAPFSLAAAAKAEGSMKGAGTVSVTSPRLSLASSTQNIRSVNSNSVAVRFPSAPFAGVQLLTSTTAGLPVCADVAEPAVPNSTRTSASCATRCEIDAMITAVVLGSGG